MKIDWKTLRLARATGDGYGESSAPIDETIQAGVKRYSADRKPAIVWVYDAEEDKKNEQLETKLFSDTKMGLALKRFVCLKAEVQSIPSDRQMREVARKAPMFYLFDPGANLFATLAGKKAFSKSGFSILIEKLWDVSFDMRLKVYAKQMGKVLDELDKLEGQKDRLTKKMTGAVGNPSKLRGLQREDEKLKAQEEKLLEKERKVLEACKLKPEFLPSTENAKK